MQDQDVFERCVPLEQGCNFRDLGGYATLDGGRVKPRMLYRSGRMDMLTDADERSLGALGIVTVCDLRSTHERESHPTRWCDAAGAHYWYRDYPSASGVLRDVLRQSKPSHDELRASMRQVYRAIPVDHAESYTAMFATLLEGRVPLLINCTAGKDRTGAAAALILHVLGVPDETIITDYLLTNDHLDVAELLKVDIPDVKELSARQEFLKPLWRAEEDYLAAMFDEMNANHGGIDGYVRSIGVDDAARERLKELLVAY